MKKLLSLIAALTMTLNAFAEVSELDRALIRGAGIQLLKNPAFESGKGDWTQSGGTFAIVTSGANLLAGKGSATFDASATAQYIQSSLYALPNGLLSRNCYAEMLYLGGDTNLSLQVLNGSSNVIASTALTVAATPTKAYFNFPCGSSGSIRLKLLSSADAAIVAIDNIVFGEAINIANISQAQAIVFEQRSAGQNIPSTSATTVTGFTESLDVYSEFNASTGVFTASSSKRIAMSAHIDVGNQNSSEVYSLIVLKNGATTVCEERSATPASLITSWTLRLTPCTVDVVAGDTVVLQVKSSADTSYDLSSGVTSQLMIYQFPSTQELAIRPDLQYWKVNANISGANPSLGTADTTTYSSISDGGLTLTNNTGGGNIAAQVPCSSTNPPTGTTCAVGNENLGVAFTPTGTFPQEVIACASFSHAVAGMAASEKVFAVFQIVETPINSNNTILQEGKSRVSSGPQATGNELQFPLLVCGNFTFTSGGQKALRLFFEQDVTGAPSQNIILADGNAANGQRDVHWEVYPINQGVQAPLIVGSVNSNSSGMERIERATFAVCSAGPCAPSTQSGTWLTGSALTRGGTGSYTLAVTAGIFSATPVCVGSVNTTSGMLNVNPTSATSVTITDSNGANVAADQAFSIICMGSR